MAKQLPYSTIREIFTRFQAAEREPKGELNHTNAYTLVVAVALSARATDVGVNKATAKLFEIADTPQKMLDLGEAALIEHIKTIGLYRNKAKNVIKLSRILVEEYGGEVPSSRAALQSLPGVGRKTANVVLNMWWRFPAQAVDTHIFRLGNRLGLETQARPFDVFRHLRTLNPSPYMYFLDLGDTAEDRADAGAATLEGGLDEGTVEGGVVPGEDAAAEQRRYLLNGVRLRERI